MTIGLDRQHRWNDSPNPCAAAGSARLSRSSLAGVGVLGALIVLFYAGPLAHLASRWSAEANYSHGFLVPFISAWLLWHRRDLLASVQAPVRGRWLGIALVVASVVVRVITNYFGYVLAEPIALILCIAGATALAGGYAALAWAWPAIVFLIFMIPLPGAVGTRLSGPLQHLATSGSTYVLQTLGIPAVASGNVICLTHGRIGVAEACNGLGMLTTFAAVTTAAVFLLKLSRWEKACVLLSSVGIAIIANIFRIAATGIAQEWIGVEFAERIFHDFAGLLMVPVALVMLGIELFVLARLFPPIAAGPLLVVRQGAPARETRRPLPSR